MIAARARLRPPSGKSLWPLRRITSSAGLRTVWDVDNR